MPKRLPSVSEAQANQPTPFIAIPGTAIFPPALPALLSTDYQRSNQIVIKNTGRKSQNYDVFHFIDMK